MSEDIDDAAPMFGCEVVYTAGHDKPGAYRPAMWAENGVWTLVLSTGATLDLYPGGES